MKLLVIHLSDTHLENLDNSKLSKVEKIANTIKKYKHVDKIALVLSGDLAASGEKNDYKAMRYLIGNLISKIHEKTEYKKFINVYLVPGNHDMNYRMIGTLPEEYTYKETEWDNKVYQETNLLENFYEYAKQQHCYEKNKFVDYQTINVQGIRINFSLINSAVFSRKSNDKGLHYFPMNHLRKVEADVSIAVMHHAPEWLLDDNKVEMEKYLRENHDILLLGHEHTSRSKEEIFESSNSIKIVNGGALFESHNEKSSNYNLIELDITNNLMNIHQYGWDEKAAMYHIIGSSENEIIRKQHNKDFPINSDFEQELSRDTKHDLGKKLEEYYVFSGVTKISQDNYADRREIDKLNLFAEQILENQIVFIEGDDNSGKTSLAKTLFRLYWSKGKVPLLFFQDEIKNKSVNKVIEEIFKKQYSGQHAFEKYQQVDKKQKVLIIDDTDKIKATTFDRMFESLRCEFGNIILISQVKWEFDLKKYAKEDIGEDNIVKYKINPFYTEKRKQLIKEICEIKNLSCEVDMGLVDRINDFIRTQMSYFKFDPDFIIRFMECFIDKKQVEYLNNNIFTQVFEASIINALQKVDSDVDTSQVSIILQEIAYNVHIEKKYPITLNLIENVIGEYRKEYGQNVSVVDSIKLWTDAKIIKKMNSDIDEYRFCDNNYLAYYVAKCINRKYYEDQECAWKALSHILENICFGINGDIVLFLSYITDNMSIIMEIYKNADAFMKEWEAFDLKEGNISFLLQCQEEQLSAPTQKDKEEHEKQKKEFERKQMNVGQIEVLDIYDYDESEITKITNQLLKAFKYTEIISKSLPNFYSNLKASQKESLKKGIYEFPNKIIYKWLQPIDSEFDNFVKEFTVELNALGNNVKESEVSDLLKRYALSMVLSIYDNFAVISVNKNSLEGLKTYNPKNVNEQIQQIMILENGRDYTAFVESVDKLYDETKIPLVKNMLKYIVTKSLVCHDDLRGTNERHLRSKYFPKQTGQLLALKNKTQNANSDK